MIEKEFHLEGENMSYSVILNTLKLNERYSIDVIFDIINNLQDKYEDSIIQFFNDEYIINQKHIFYAVYFSQKAFQQNINISNKLSIEFLLYLAANRQIKIAIESFGISNYDIENGSLNVCIASHKKQVMQIYKELLQLLNVEEIIPKFKEISTEKIQKIKQFYEISKNQISTILSSLDSRNITEIGEVEKLNIIADVCLDLIREKMTLLSLEGVSFN